MISYLTIEDLEFWAAHAAHSERWKKALARARKFKKEKREVDILWHDDGTTITFRPKRKENPNLRIRNRRRRRTSK